MTETVTKPYRLASGEGLADVWWKTGRVTVKAGPDETGNAFSQFEVNDPRGSGPPLHVHHNEDETFYILEGQVTMVVGDERIDLEARLLVLRKRLAALECGITLDRVDRGRLSLGVSAPLTLVEVATTGPMRAAHQPPAGG